jgi:8-amino-7-oxononanoate synthase
MTTMPVRSGAAHAAHLSAAAATRRAAGLQRHLRPRPAQPATIDLASNDYLSLARDPRLAAAAAAAAHEWGTGAGASRLVTGSLALHTELEHALAELSGAPAALLFSSGYLANLGAITALADADTLIVSDADNHASIIDGCRLARAEVQVVAHRDTAAVTRALADRRQQRALVVTDAVFSADGDVADLERLARTCDDHDALLLVDEAHSLGVLGPRGGGAAAAAGISDHPHVLLTATLSKSLAAQGGAVLGPPEVLEHLVNTARSLIFDTGLAPSPAAAALRATELLLADGEALTGATRAAALRLHELAVEIGWRSVPPAAAVVSLLVGDPTAAVAAQEVCAANGVTVGCFRPPSVPANGSRLRLTAHAGLTADDFAVIRLALIEARRALGNHNNPGH